MGSDVIAIDELGPHWPTPAAQPENTRQFDRARSVLAGFAAATVFSGACPEQLQLADDGANLHFFHASNSSVRYRSLIAR